jgi:hypothetical protein
LFAVDRARGERGDLFEGKDTCTGYLQRRRNLWWDESRTGQNGVLHRERISDARKAYALPSPSPSIQGARATRPTFLGFGGIHSERPGEDRVLSILLSLSHPWM